MRPVEDSVMTSHFGIVVTDSNKRGENEALNEEEKRQMYVSGSQSSIATSETF